MEYILPGSLPQNSPGLRAVGVVILIILTFLGVHIFDKRSCPFEVDNRCVVLESVETHELRSQGLSGRQDLDKYSGMLFVFDETGRQCMWMKDMKFPIDMIWVGEDRRINKIEAEVSPATYPQSFCGDNSKYVIEVNAGAAGAANLKIGQKLPL